MNTKKSLALFLILLIVIIPNNAYASSSIALSLSNGYVGKVVTITGSSTGALASRWTNGDTITVTITGHIGNISTGTITVSSNSFSGTIRIPNDATIGSDIITATDQHSHSATASFTAQSLILTENISIIDSVKKSINKNLLELISVSDIEQNNANKMIGISESVSFTDIMQRNTTRTINLNETLLFNDTTRRQTSKTINLNEQIISEDNATANKLVTILLDESVNVIDDISNQVQKNYAVNLVEDITTSDNTNLSKQIINFFSIILNEILGISDNANTNGMNSQALTENISITDTVTISKNNIPVSRHVSESTSPSQTRLSFGGIPGKNFTDGLTINEKTFDISKFKDAIQTQNIPLNESVSFTIKAQPYNSMENWKHFGLYFNYDNPNMDIQNFDTSIIYDKSNGLAISDPHGFMKDASFHYTTDSKYLYFTITFTPIKEMKTSNIIISLWDMSGRVNNLHLINATSFGQIDPIDPPSIPYHCFYGVCMP